MSKPRFRTRGADKVKIQDKECRCQNQGSAYGELLMTRLRSRIQRSANIKPRFGTGDDTNVKAKIQNKEGGQLTRLRSRIRRGTNVKDKIQDKEDCRYQG